MYTLLNQHTVSNTVIRNPWLHNRYNTTTTTVTSTPLANIINSFIITFISVHFRNLRRNYYLKLLVVVTEIKSVFYTLLKVLIKYEYIYSLLAQDLITHMGVSFNWYQWHGNEIQGRYGGDPYK